MQRRNFLRSLFAAIAAAFMPWRKAKALPPPKTKEQIQQEILQAWLQRPSDRPVFSRMVYPLRMPRSYADLGRQTFLIEPLPPGATPVWDRDNDDL